MLSSAVDTTAIRVSLSPTIEAMWLAGSVPLAQVGRATVSCTPDIYVTVAVGARPLLRIDVYASCSLESYAFEDAMRWGDFVFVGFGHHVYAVRLTGEVSAHVDLGTYFGSFHVGSTHLLIASCSRLLCLDSDAQVLWQSDELGIDGVVVHSADEAVIRGQGEWDPPGGWKAFVLDAVTGLSLR